MIILNPNELHFACLLKGKTRTGHAKEVIVETLRAIAPEPVIKDQLQKLARIRRTKFLEILDYLIRNHVIVKIGTGTKGDPFKYGLCASYQPAASTQPQQAPASPLLEHFIPAKKRLIITSAG